MERIEKIKSMSIRKEPTKDFPSIKSTSITVKAMMALSKFEIDSRTIQRDQPTRTTSSPFDQDNVRAQSGFSIHKSRELQTTEPRSNTRGQHEPNPSASFKLQLRDIHEMEMQNYTQPLVLDKSKVSSKAYGLIHGYSANSHAGPLLGYNQDRICIVTNLTKNSTKHKQVSFFGVYDGNNGTNRADYMRDNYHLMLIQDEAFPHNMQIALRRSLHRLNVSFSEESRFNGDCSSVSFAIIVVLGESIHYLQSDNCKAVFSQKLGENIFFPSRTSSSPLGRESSKRTRSVTELIKRSERVKEHAELEYRQFSSTDGLDFVLLGTEGVWENIKVREMGRKLWMHLLRNRQLGIHMALGQANNLLLGQIFANLSTKNASIIIIGFEGVASCMEEEGQLCLPYLQ